MILSFSLPLPHSIAIVTSCSLVYCSWKGVLISSPSMVAEIFSLMCPETSCSLMDRFSVKQN